MPAYSVAEMETLAVYSAFSLAWKISNSVFSIRDSDRGGGKTSWDATATGDVKDIELRYS